ncbi:MAG: biotin--[acetyl-CoA-carboxylase] ligase [Clostridiales Family XIII bacterium]|jgi:BirA family biotin operon repressor/biotin-[acetyl-CoA-carboxylase] ligase|nr:biotin--[acetyl-CoA-carboxylase] ligase [Clostridiales Family XIII bacterium]
MSIREETLRILEANRGDSVSGETLAKSMGVSRTAVWKAVAGLKREGYPIDAGTNRGYTLSEESGILSFQGMSPWFGTQGDGSSVPTLVFHRSIDSTNNEAKRLIAAAPADGIPFGSVIIAEEQTAGRGRRGRSFFAPATGGIYISFILKPAGNIEHSLRTTVAAAVAVCRAIEIVSEGTQQPKIKWVNDLFIDGKKICGILTEAVSDIESGEIESIVLGIGININVTEDVFPEELRHIAGSVRMPARDRNRFAAVLIEQVFSAYETLSEDGALMDEYRRRSFIVGRSIQVIRGDKKISAIALGINDDGSLSVEYADGKRETLRSGEVSITANG